MKALLVDDEDNFLEQTKIYIEDNLENISVDTAKDVEEALERFDEEEYHGIISDYQMPDIDGLEFLKIIREEKNSDIPFIIFTGRGREDVAMKALNLGANRYLQKGGDPRSQYGVLSDALIKEIEAYKKEKRLRESERTYREMFDKVGIPIFLHDIDSGRVINANKEAAEMYGYTKEEIEEMQVGSFSADGEGFGQEKVKEQIQAAIEEGPQKFLWRGEKKDGTKTWEKVKLTPAEIKGETRVLATINDITDLKRIENEKERNLKELQFINETILQVSNMDDIDAICSYLGEQVHSVNEDSYVFVSLYDEEKDAITLRSATGLGDSKEDISVFFEDVKDMGLNIDEMGGEKELYTSGKIENVSGGLHTLLAGKFDEDTCQSIEDLLVIESTYTVGFALGNEPYGGIILLKTEEGDLRYKRAIETLARHLSVMLQHKQAEQRRKTLEKRYKALFERSLDGVYLFNMDGDFIDANPRAVEMLGYPKDELDSLNYKDIFTVDSIKKIERTIEKIREKGAQEDPTELKAKRKDGEEIWVETKTHILYRDDEPYAYQGIAREITERKKMEEQMRKKERAIQTSLNGITMADLDADITYVNDSLVEMWGFDDPDEIIGRNTLEFFHDKEETQRAIEQLFQAGRWKGELKGERKDGSLIDVFLSANLIYDEEGEPTDILASLIDISDNKTTIKKIEKLHDITQNLETCDEEEEVFDLAIDAAEKILDFEMCTIDSVEGDNFVVQATSSNVKPEGSQSTSLDQGIAGKTYREGDSYLINDISNDEVADPVRSEYRSALSVPIGNFGVFQAVSTGKDQFDEQDVNMAELLMDHVKETLKRIKSSKKQEFLHSLLRHDVKNKTQIVEGYLNLIEDTELSKEQSEYVEKALKATEEGKEILEKVKALREVKDEEIEDVDVKGPLKKAIDSNKEIVKGSGIDIKYEDTYEKEESCLVKGGPLLEELFFNIINNAVNHSDCAEVNISITDDDKRCIVVIKDDGTGITDEEKQKVFKKGYKKGDHAGSGLGLHLAKTIVDSYGGNIEIEDSELGGAKFIIKLKKSQ